MLTSIDYQLFLFFNTFFSNPFFDFVIPHITSATNLTIFYFSLSAIYIAMAKDKILALKRVVVASIILGLADLLGARVLKEFFERPRPNNALYFVDGVHILFPNVNFGRPSNAFVSFPSNHAMTNAAVATVWTLWAPKLWWIFVPFALFIGFTRIYVGVHYPLDILFGFIFGAGLGFLAYKLSKRFLEKKTDKKIKE
ncbi:MAG: phosphatase PAP2 family protein [Chitinivibrionia bacterium]|nr:phosphatase PAP2 family protein [Chitinivibrionia bacterium]